MNNLFRHLIIVLLPLILSNILHMLVVKQNYISRLKIPIWEKGFGENKTWRGLIFIPIVNSFMMELVNLNFQLLLKSPAYLGFILGLAYIIFELPNSFLKRKLGIKAGEKHLKFKFLFLLIDKMDSAFGVAFTYFILGFVDFKLAIILFIINSFTHIVVSQLLVFIKIKKHF